MIKDIKNQPVFSYLSLNQKPKAMKTKIITGILFLLMTGISVKAQNLLKNGDLESTPPDGTTPGIGWKYDWSPDESGAINTSTAARTGNCGFWIYTAKTGKNSYTKPYQETGCKSSTNYRAEIYLRTPEGENWVTGSSAYITLTFKTSAGVTVQTLNSDKLTTGNTGWKLFTINAVSPENAALVRYTINLTSPVGQSICNADNCSLVIVK